MLVRNSPTSEKLFKTIMEKYFKDHSDNSFAENFYGNTIMQHHFFVYFDREYEQTQSPKLLEALANMASKILSNNRVINYSLKILSLPKEQQSELDIKNIYDILIEAYNLSANFKDGLKQAIYFHRTFENNYTLNKLAEQYKLNNNFNMALQYSEQITLNNENIVEVLFRKGFCCIKLNKIDDAHKYFLLLEQNLPHIDTLTDGDNLYKILYFTLQTIAEYYYQKNDYLNSYIYYKKFLLVDETKDELFFNTICTLAEYIQRNGNMSHITEINVYEEYIQIYQKMIRKKFTMHDEEVQDSLFLQYGKSALLSKQPNLIIEEIDRLISLNKTFKEIYSHYFIVSIDLAITDSKFKNLNKYIEILISLKKELNFFEMKTVLYGIYTLRSNGLEPKFQYSFINTQDFVLEDTLCIAAINLYDNKILKVKKNLTSAINIIRSSNIGDYDEISLIKNLIPKLLDSLVTYICKTSDCTLLTEFLTVAKKNLVELFEESFAGAIEILNQKELLHYLYQILSLKKYEELNRDQKKLFHKSLIAKNNIPEAIEYLEKFVIENTQDSSSRYDLGSLLLSTKNYERALQHAIEGLNIEGNNTDGQKLVAKLYFLNNDHKNFMKFYEEHDSCNSDLQIKFFHLISSVETTGSFALSKTLKSQLFRGNKEEFAPVIFEYLSKNFEKSSFAKCGKYIELLLKSGKQFSKYFEEYVEVLFFENEYSEIAKFLADKVKSINNPRISELYFLSYLFSFRKVEKDINSNIDDFEFVEKIEICVKYLQSINESRAVERLVTLLQSTIIETSLKLEIIDRMTFSNKDYANLLTNILELEFSPRIKDKISSKILDLELDESEIEIFGNIYYIKLEFQNAADIYKKAYREGINSKKYIKKLSQIYCISIMDFEESLKYSRIDDQLPEADESKYFFTCYNLYKLGKYDLEFIEGLEKNPSLLSKFSIFKEHLAISAIYTLQETRYISLIIELLKSSQSFFKLFDKYLKDLINDEKYERIKELSREIFANESCDKTIKEKLSIYLVEIPNLDEEFHFIVEFLSYDEIDKAESLKDQIAKNYLDYILQEDRIFIKENLPQIIKYGKDNIEFISSLSRILKEFISHNDFNKSLYISSLIDKLQHPDKISALTLDILFELKEYTKIVDFFRDNMIFSESLLEKTTIEIISKSLVVTDEYKEFFVYFKDTKHIYPEFKTFLEKFISHLYKEKNSEKSLILFEFYELLYDGNVDITLKLKIHYANNNLNYCLRIINDNLASIKDDSNIAHFHIEILIKLNRFFKAAKIISTSKITYSFELIKYLLTELQASNIKLVKDQVYNILKTKFSDNIEFIECYFEHLYIKKDYKKLIDYIFENLKLINKSLTIDNIIKNTLLAFGDEYVKEKELTSENFRDYIELEVLSQIHRFSINKAEKDLLLIETLSERIFKLAPDNVFSFIDLLSAKIELCKFTEYFALIDKHKHFLDQNFLVKYSYAQILVKFQRYEEAQKYLEESVRLNSDFLDSHFELFSLLVKHSEFEDSKIRALEIAEYISSKSNDFDFEIMMVYLQKNDSTNVSKFFTKYSYFHPSDENIHLYKVITGMIDFKNGKNKFNAVKSVIENIYKINRTDSLDYEAAKMMLKCKIYDHSLNLIDVAISKNSSNVDYYIFKGIICTITQDFVTAEVSLFKANELNPNDYRPFKFLAILYNNVKNYDSAMMSIKLAISLNQDDYTLKMLLGKFYMNIGKILEAKKIFDDIHEHIIIKQVESELEQISEVDFQTFSHFSEDFVMAEYLSNKYGVSSLICDDGGLFHDANNRNISLLADIEKTFDTDLE